jgi:sulfate transport system ATP-binding protein
VKQAGSPAELYENPASPFVMSFLGPVTRLGGRLVRPHDIELSRTPLRDSHEAVVGRIVHLGFEVRVEMQADGEDVWAQVTRGTAAQLGVRSGDRIHVRAGASAEPAAPGDVRPDHQRTEEGQQGDDNEPAPRVGAVG